MRRRFHVLAARPGVDRRPAAVVHAVTDHRPAVVQAGTYQVELVATLRSVFVGPQLAGLRVHEQPLRVPVTVAPDLGQGARLPDERIVVGRLAVVAEAHRDPVVVRHVLRGMGRQIAPRAGHAIAHRDEEVAVAVPREPPPVVTAPLRLRLEDVLDGGEPVVLEPASDDRRRRALSLRPGVAQVQQTVGREVGMWKHTSNSPPCPLANTSGTPGTGSGSNIPVTHDAQTPRAFGDQHLAVRQPRDGPRDVETVGHDNGAKIVMGRPMHLLRGGLASREHPPGGGARDGDSVHRQLL